MLELAERPKDASTSATSARRAEDGRGRIERVLFERRDAGDRRARDELIDRFLPLARSLARAYEHCGEPLEDLVQVASLALVKAVDRYDLAHGVAFSSYAVPTIAGELKRHFRDRTWAVRPPRELQELTLRVDRAVVALSVQLDRAPTVTELAAAIDRSDEDVLEALQARRARYGLSLQASASGEDEQPVLQDMLGMNDDGYARVEARILLDALLAGVVPRTREVLRLRFEQDLTQAEIGTRFGVSQMQVSRIIRLGLGQLRHVADQQQRMAEARRYRGALVDGATHSPACGHRRAGARLAR